MQIVRYQPFLRDMQNEINQLFHRNWLVENDASDSAVSQWSPHVDIKEEADKFIVTGDFPGVEPKDIQISIENNMLTIKGHRTLERTDKGKEYTRMERFSGTFYRQFTLPEYVDGENIQAKSKNGVVAIVIPKKARHTAKRIEVQPDES